MQLLNFYKNNYMKINKLNSWKFLLPVLLFSTFSCKKVLEEKPLSFLSPENFYKDEADAKAAINSIYGALYTYDLYLQPMWNLTMLDDDHVSGADWFLGTSGAGNPQGYWGVDGPWVGCYTVIARANTVLENVGAINSNIDPIVKNRILGEAYFFRGWAYFQLVQLYGGVPIRLKSLSLDPTASIARSSVADVYKQIITDFKSAESNLLPAKDPKAGEVGRVNRAVAKGFLAKTYMTMASGAATGNVSVRGGADNGMYTYSKPVVAGLENISSKDYYTLARDKALEVITSNEYSLYTNWTDLWNKAGRNKTEHMWQLQALGGSAFVNELHNYMSAFSTFGRGAMWFTNNHYRDYDTTDIRVLNGVVHNYEMNNAARTKYFYPSWQSYNYKIVNGATYANNGTTDDRAYTIKYSDVADPTVSRSDAHFSMIRFSEMYLIVAEADNEINNGPSTQAYTALNTIRTRAKTQTAPANLTRDEFRSFVLAERAREFVFEGIRRYDLMRWGIYLQVMNKIGIGQNNITKVRNTRNLLLPIPQSELNSNTLIPANNPGW
jgi:starch-binding outer membrane protein, SusD/RagB family